MGAWVKIAEISRTKNLQGRLVARSVDGLPFLLSEGLSVRFVPPRDDVLRGSVVEEVRPGGSDAFIVKFAGIDGIDEAEKLIGSFCLARRDDLPQDFDVVTKPLTGARVFDARRGDIGQVVDVISSSAQSTLVVEGPFAQVLIPLVEAFVLDVDAQAGRIDVEVPDDLIDLNAPPHGWRAGGEGR